MKSSRSGVSPESRRTLRSASTYIQRFSEIERRADLHTPQVDGRAWLPEEVRCLYAAVAGEVLMVGQVVDVDEDVHAVARRRTGDRAQHERILEPGIQRL